MSTSELHVLIVDDEPILQKLIEHYLSEQGMRVGCVPDGREMDRYRQEQAATPVDLLVMDLNMPGEDGLSITRRLRAAGDDIPIIMLSSMGDEVDRIVGLEVGVDDYLQKPPNPRELLARVKAVMRRRPDATAVSAPEPAAAQSRFALDLRSRQAARDGAPLALTDSEFNLLRVLMDNPGQELSRDFLMDALKGYEHTPFDRTIDVRVRRLRKKVEDDPATPRHILTVWGKGYLFVPEGTAC